MSIGYDKQNDIAVESATEIKNAIFCLIFHVLFISFILILSSFFTHY